MVLLFDFDTITINECTLYIAYTVCITHIESVRETATEHPIFEFPVHARANVHFNLGHRHQYHLKTIKKIQKLLILKNGVCRWLP